MEPAHTKPHIDQTTLQNSQDRPIQIKDDDLPHRRSRPVVVLRFVASGERGRSRAIAAGAAMRLAYILLFLFLHLSAASTCHATSRSRHLFLPGTDADAPAPLPAIHGRIAKDDLSFYGGAQYPAATTVVTARRALPGVRLMISGGVGGAPLPLPGLDDASGEDEQGAPPPPPLPSSDAMQPSPSPPQVDEGGHGEDDAGGGGGGGAAEGGSSSPPPEGSATDDQEESAADDVGVGVDYAAPKTHPPSHN